MQTPQSSSDSRQSEDEENLSHVHPTSAPHTITRRSTPTNDESDFAISMSHSALVEEGTQSRDLRSSLRVRQNTSSPEDSDPEPEQSAFLSEHPSGDELPTNDARHFSHQASVSVNTEGRASGEALRSREEPPPNGTTNQSSSVPVGNHQNLEWVPYTLRWQSLTILVISTVVLLSLVIALWWRSVVNNGLGTDDGSSMLLFGWRFTPPLLAVLYVQLTAMLLDDVKRTECFARMARPGGASAASSILRAPGAWWNALADGLSKHGGHRSWLLFSTACLNIIGFLAISPLSSSFLELQEVMVTTDVDFTRMNTQQRLSLTSSRDTKLRIIGHVLQNISTSAWILDNYTILPFWPSTLANAALGSELPGPFQTWQAETWVLSTELDCNPVSLVNITTVSDITDINGMYVNGGRRLDPPKFSEDLPGTWLLSSSDKCKYKLRSPDYQEAMWYNDLVLDRAVQQSEECEETEMILFVPEDNATRVSGHACFGKYYIAEMTVTVHVSNIDSSVVFDKQEYSQKRQPITNSFLNAEELQNLSLAGDWPEYLPLTKSSRSKLFQDTCKGLSALLCVVYDFDFEAMVDDNTLISRAEKVKQEAFAEILQYSLQAQRVSTDNVAGKATNIKSRVIVTAGVAIALASFLWVSLFLQLAVWSLSRTRSRPLNLGQDPAAAIGITTLIDIGSQTHENLRNLQQNSETLVPSVLGKKRFFTTYNKLHVLNSAAAIPEVEEDGSPKSSDWRPLVLRLRTLVALGFYLATLITAVLVLYYFAQRSSLYRTAFVYQAKIPVFGVHTLTPFSLVPTLLAVVVGLWWGSIDVTFRRLQPYLSMVEAPQPLAHGAGLSYQSSYWVWAVLRAASKKHWFLLLVTAGTSLSPVLTIAMSALLERTQTNVSTVHQASRGLELRQVPYLRKEDSFSTFEGYSNSDLIWELFTNLSTNWLYSATLQLTMGGSQPPWSRDGWSFTPIDLAQISNESQNMDSLSPDWVTNVSITTPAIRARLECGTYENLNNLSAWLTLQEFKNISEWNASTIPHAIKSAYQLGYRIETEGRSGDGEVWPYFFNTSYFTDGTIPTCCTNGSSWPPLAAALGRWSVSGSPDGAFQPPFNLTTKWIHGPLISGLKNVRPLSAYDKEFAMFLEIPSVQALDCTPIIETSSAWVTVDQESGSVKEFSILDKPEAATEAWAHSFVTHRDDSMTFFNMDYFNMTVRTKSYGAVFLTSLLHASSLNWNEGLLGLDLPWVEDLNDQAFTFRDTDHGLNLDIMTYAMYALAGKDPQALLNASTMEATAQKTFTTFFQHFVSSNVSFGTGGSWAYQPINATLPPCLAYNRTSSACAEQPSVWPLSHTNSTVDVQISRRVSLLRMNKVAVWLSVGILAWLIATTVVVAATMNRHLKGLKGDVERVADVLLMVAGSDKLLRLLKERGERKLAEEEVMTKLGWFEDRDGQLRWGIEVVEGENESEDD